MTMASSIRSVVDDVLAQIVPRQEDRKLVESTTELIESLVGNEVNKSGLDIDIEVGGSVAKDTWLRKDVDIDLFMLFPTSIDKRRLGEYGLSIAKKAVQGYVQRERYAEHAYLEAWVNDVRVNIVPCYKAGEGNWRSAADRSPFHTRYVVSKLKPTHLEDDIRVFKKFIKGIDAYGAEIRVKGLSGYLCELLIIHYGSFEKTLQAIGEWRYGKIIDPEKQYDSEIKKAQTLFPASLVVIDPVDKNRNVAAAVSKDRLAELIIASRLFIEDPSICFFYLDKASASQTNLTKNLHTPYDVIVVQINTDEEIPDILWGELRKTQKALERLLRNNDFNVIRSDVWTDETETSAVLIGLESKNIAKIRTRDGPPGDTDGVQPFLEKYARDSVIGPWVEEGKWNVGLKRRSVSAEALLKEALSDGGLHIGVSRGLSDSLASSRVRSIKDSSLNKRADFSRFLEEFLEGRPRWLSRYYSSSSTVPSM
jgi:tRNA nucleotidyltransferase (CCA-adding enzyme)